MTHPFRTFVHHVPCTTTQRLGRQLARQLATDPTSIVALHCTTCRAKFPVAEFVWVDDYENGNPNVAGDLTAYVVGT